MSKDVLWWIGLTKKMHLLEVLEILLEAIVIFISLAALALIWVLRRFEHLFIYFNDHPKGSRRILMDPAKYDMPQPESLLLTMHDEAQIHTWFFKQSKEAPTIIFLHGNAANISGFLPRLRTFYVECKANVLAIEYRGYGLSDGDIPNQQDIIHDCRQVISWFMSSRAHDIDAKRVFLVGLSLGGAVAIHVAAHCQEQLTGLIVENTFVSAERMAGIRYLGWILKNPWNSGREIQKLTLPCLFLSSGRDMVISPLMM